MVSSISRDGEKNTFARPAKKKYLEGEAARIGPQNVVFRCEDTLHEMKKCPEGVLAEHPSEPGSNSL